jgi:hypothetical protein
MSRIAAIENLFALALVVAGCWRLWDWPVAAIVGGGLMLAVNGIVAWAARGSADD